MNKPSPIFWLAIVLIFLLPSAVGRFLLDFAGGVILVILLIPILIGGIGFITWKLIKPKFQQCNECGTTFFNEVNTCPICGSNIPIKEGNNRDNNIPASSVVIDITPEEAKES